MCTFMFPCVYVCVCVCICVCVSVCVCVCICLCIYMIVYMYVCVFMCLCTFCTCLCLGVSACVSIMCVCDLCVCVPQSTAHLLAKDSRNGSVPPARGASSPHPTSHLCRWRVRRKEPEPRAKPTETLQPDLGCDTHTSPFVLFPQPLPEGVCRGSGRLTLVLIKLHPNPGLVQQTKRVLLGPLGASTGWGGVEGLPHLQQLLSASGCPTTLAARLNVSQGPPDGWPVVPAPWWASGGPGTSDTVQGQVRGWEFSAVEKKQFTAPKQTTLHGSARTWIRKGLECTQMFRRLTG